MACTAYQQNYMHHWANILTLMHRFSVTTICFSITFIWQFGVTMVNLTILWSSCCEIGIFWTDTEKSDSLTREYVEQVWYKKFTYEWPVLALVVLISSTNWVVISLDNGLTLMGRYWFIMNDTTWNNKQCKFCQASLSFIQGNLTSSAMLLSWQRRFEWNCHVWLDPILKNHNFMITSPWRPYSAELPSGAITTFSLLRYAFTHRSMRQ